MAAKTAQHLGIVFHRYLENRDGLVITVNGQKSHLGTLLRPARRRLPSSRFSASRWTSKMYRGLSRCAALCSPRAISLVRWRNSSGILGPLNWNRQQGLYIYRADRLVQWGGWNGIRGIDEHTKLARAALEFDTDLDSMFNINVAKMRVTIPPQIRQMLERPINELCAHADLRYRKASRQP